MPWSDEPPQLTARVAVAIRRPRNVAVRVNAIFRLVVVCHLQSLSFLCRAARPYRPADDLGYLTPTQSSVSLNPRFLSGFGGGNRSKKHKGVDLLVALAPLLIALVPLLIGRLKNLYREGIDAIVLTPPHA